MTNPDYSTTEPIAVTDALRRIAVAARVYQLARAGGEPELEREAWLPLDAALVDFFREHDLTARV